MFLVFGSCSFEPSENSQSCAWSRDPKGDHDWVLEYGTAANNPLSGPPYDHTYQSRQGNYFNQRQGTKKIIKSHFSFRQES